MLGQNQPNEFNSAEPPDFQGKRLLYLATGAISAMWMPIWLRWLRTSYLDIETRYGLTRAALRFVGPSAVAVAGGSGEPLVDAWPDAPEHALHVELAEWPDTVLVYPATMHFIARFAQGLADSPILLALQCTEAAIAVCPSLPPGGHRNPAFRRHAAELAERDNVVILPPAWGTSISSGKAGPGSVVPLPQALAALEDLRAWMADSNG